MVTRSLMLLLGVGLLLGCSAADDAGSEAAPPAKATAASSEVVDSVEQWWEDLGKPEADPNDATVKCHVDGTIRFTRLSDCKASGGWPDHS